MQKKTSIAFFGDFPFSLEHLKTLYFDDRYEIELVVTSKNTEGFTNHVSRWSEENLGQPKNLHFSQKDLIVERLQNCELLLAAGFTRKIPGNLFLKNGKNINVHPSYLPLLRGPDPVRTALIDDIDSFGISYHQLTENFDEGAVYWQQKYQPQDLECHPEILKKLELISTRELNDNLEEIVSGKRKASPQKECLHFARTMTEADRTISSSDSVKQAQGKLRAFSPDKGCFYKNVGNTWKVFLGDTESLQLSDGAISVSIQRGLDDLSQP